jgi:hypothetical protein
MDPSAVLNVIKDLPLTEALVYLTAKEISDYSQKGFAKIKEWIKDKYNEKKFAFFPNKEEALKIKELSTNADYRSIILLVPKYPYVDVIRTGLLIKEYIENPSDANQSRAKEIKNQLSKRPNGNKLLNTVHLVTTPYFGVVINHLFSLQRKGYTEQQLMEEFDEILINWNDSYLPVKSEYSEKFVEQWIKNQINSRKSKFFLIGMKSAVGTIEKVIKKFEDEDFFQSKDYKKNIIKGEEGIEPRVEVTIFLGSKDYHNID